MPSAFEIGLSDCRWVYRLDDRTVTVRAIADGDEPAMQWRILVEGEPCRFLVFGHLVLGERELDHAGRIEIDAAAQALRLPAGPGDRFGASAIREAVYHLVTGTPGAVEAVGGDELLYADGRPRGGAYVALRTRATRELASPSWAR